MNAEAAVDIEHGTVDISGIIRSEKQYSRCLMVRLACRFALVNAVLA
jgi:hypothetical protein